MSEYPTEKEWMDMIKFQLEQATKNMMFQFEELTKAYLASPCCGDYKNCTKQRCIPRLEYLLNEAIDGNHKLVDEYTSVCAHSDRQAEAIKRLHKEKREIWNALAESVKLQTHYALLLNEYDGGERILFDSADAFIKRLSDLAKAQNV